MGPMGPMGRSPPLAGLDDPVALATGEVVVTDSAEGRTLLVGLIVDAVVPAEAVVDDPAADEGGVERLGGLADAAYRFLDPVERKVKGAGGLGDDRGVVQVRL